MNTEERLEDIEKIAKFQKVRYFNKKEVNRKLTLRQSLDFIQIHINEIRLNEDLN